LTILHGIGIGNSAFSKDIFVNMIKTFLLIHYSVIVVYSDGSVVVGIVIAAAAAASAVVCVCVCVSRHWRGAAV
jgi:hypothetical protein